MKDDWGWLYDNRDSRCPPIIGTIHRGATFRHGLERKYFPKSRWGWDTCVYCGKQDSVRSNGISYEGLGYCMSKLLSQEGALEMAYLSENVPTCFACRMAISKLEVLFEGCVTVIKSIDRLAEKMNGEASESASATTNHPNDS